MHGATGVDQDLISHPHRPPPCLPIAALVQFPHYTGPAFLQTDCLTVPIPPHLFEWVMGDGKGLSRQQLPLQLQYAMTIHKSQGQTLAQNVVDLGKAERATGCSYVALSKPMAFRRLQLIGKSKQLQERLREEERLRNLAQITALQYQPDL